MGLERLHSDAESRAGVYLLLTYFGLDKIALMQLPAEDFRKGKKEGDVLLDDQLHVLTPDMYSTISGGVKAGESHREAAIREALQEGGLDLQSQPEQVKSVEMSLPTTQTLQERNGRLTYITGQGFTYEVTPVGLDILQQHLNRHAQQLLVVELSELVSERSTLRLRPFMSGLLHALIAQSK